MPDIYPEIRIDPFPSPEEFAVLCTAAWGSTQAPDYARILPCRLAHLGA